MDMYVSSSGVWKKITSAYVSVSSGGTQVWKQITSGYVSVLSGGVQVWKKFYPGSVSPSVAQTVAISRNNATYPSTLTGTNYRWTDSTSITYVFQKSADNSSWSNIGSATSIANPSIGSSNTVTYALTIADMPAYTSYYRFVVTAVNSTYSTSTTSTSSSVSVLQPAPINTVAPSVSPSSGTVGVTTYSTTNGTWNPDDSDGIYAYQWQYNDQGSTWVSISGATSSSYSPPSNFLTFYVSPIRCRVTATNSSGSTAAFSNEVTVSASTPTGGSVSLSPSGNQYAGTTLTASTTGWSGSPTSYSVRIYASTSNPPTTGNLLVASSTSSSVSYTITDSDAAAPAFYFKAFATATNSGGTSSQVESNVVLSVVRPVAPSGGSVTLSGSGVAGTSLTASTSGWSGSPTSYNIYIYASTSNPPYMSDVFKASSASTSVSYTVTTFDASPPPYYFRAFATATNAAGTSSIAVSSVILSSLPAVSAPSTPTGVTNTYNGGTSYTFSWNASSGATGYYINYGENSTAPSSNPPASIVGNVRSNVVFTSSTSYSFTSLSSSNYVGFQVAATNSGGTSSYSSPTVYR